MWKLSNLHIWKKMSRSPNCNEMRDTAYHISHGRSFTLYIVQIHFTDKERPITCLIYPLYFFPKMLGRVT